MTDDGVPLPDDQRPIGFWLKLVDRLIDERFADTLDEHGVTRRQWQVLTLLRRGPASREELDVAVAPFLAATRVVPAAPEEASTAGSGEPESTAAEVDELVESEWIADSISGFVLTPKGEQSVTRLGELVDGIRTAVSSGIDDEDYAVTVATLEVMARNLGWRNG